MVHLRFICLFFIFIGVSSLVNAQLITVAGKITEEGNSSVLSGANVKVRETGARTSSDVEGRFFFKLEKGKKYSLEISSMGFSTKVVDDVLAEEGANVEVTITRAKAKEIEGIVITSTAKKESIASIYTIQKNASSISDGISAEVIRKSPDLNTGQVLKRISGASVQDNKFVIVRGLNERYNVSMLNNTILPSTEPDKKAFAFDIIPSFLIDNLVVYKTATPDLPGDFSGGAIKVTTKDYPSKPISEIVIGTGFNTMTTFQNFYKGFPDGKLDWLGFFDNSRAIPASYLPYRGSSFINLPSETKQSITKDFPNTFGSQPALKSYPNFGVTYTGGNTTLLKNNRKLGYIFNLSYISQRRVAERERSDYQIDKFLLYVNNTNNYDQHNQLSSLFNLTYAYKKSKISWKNMFNNDFSNILGVRHGMDRSNDPYVFQYKSQNTEATGNGLFNSVLEGLHTLGSKWKFDWNGSASYTYRNQPDQKVLTFRTPDNDPGNYYIKLGNENSPEIRNAGRVFSSLKEMIYGGNANFTYNLPSQKRQQKLKFGLSNFFRDRSVKVTGLGYASLNYLGVTIPESKDVTFNTIFSPENISRYDLTIANIGTNSTDYTGQSLMNGGYAMYDGSISDKLKLTGGLRVERYWQQLKALNQPTITLDNTDFLPSVLLTYSLNNKTNFRLASFQAVNRPEFRELASYSVYDYDNNLVIRGNPLLTRSKNTNADLRYEYFPGSGEIISASLFYKYFDKPIEQVNAGNDVLSYENATHASTYGAEIEIRKRLDFIGADFFRNLMFYTNLAYMRGGVKFGDVSYKNPMQGQSPYLINAGLNYATKNDDLSINILYNRIGPRLKYRAVIGGALNIYEKPRDLVDASISKKMMKQRVELKLMVSDILAQPFAWYYKFDSNTSKIGFDPTTDKIINSAKFGTSFMLTAKINLNK